MRFAQPAAAPGSPDPLRVELLDRLRDTTLRRIVVTPLGLLASELALKPLAPPGLGLELWR